MSRSIYRRFQDTIANGAVLQKSVNGRFLTILDNTSSQDLLWSIDNQSFEQIPKGISVELPFDQDGVPIYFGDIFIQNNTGASVTITYAISAGQIYDNRVVISAATVLLTNNTGGTMTTPVKYTATTGVPGAAAVAAAASTRTVGIVNNGANPVWIGDANVDGANSRGLLIAPASTIFLDTSAAIYLRSTGGSSDCGIMILAT